jgi:hypothetical protein
MGWNPLHIELGRFMPLWVTYDFLRYRKKLARSLLGKQS